MSAATKESDRMTALADELTKTAIRKQIGRGKFTLNDFIEEFDVSRSTARRTVNVLLEQGDLEQTGVVRTGNRGRPSHAFRVTTGSSNGKSDS